MNPSVFQFGPIDIHLFTAWLLLGAVIGIIIVFVSAVIRRERLTPYLDVIMAMVVAGTVGARLVHVWLNWAYFSEHNDQIASLSNGGLDWHGAVVFGLVAATLTAIVRRVKLRHLFDSLALVFPVAAVVGWLASAAANSVYGVELRTLADFPAWLVIESPDVYGTIAPRINLLPIGITLAGAILLIALVITGIRWFKGGRLFLVLAIFSLGMGFIAFFRAEYVPLWWGRRADQILDFAIALVAIILFGLITLMRNGTAKTQAVSAVPLQETPTTN